MYCVRAADGSEVWKRKMPAGVLGRLGADRQRLYVGCGVIPFEPGIEPGAIGTRALVDVKTPE